MRSLFPALFAAVVFATGCPSPKAGPTEPGGVKGDEPPKVAQVMLLSDVNGKPGNEVAKFDYRQQTQHFRALLDKPVKDATGTWVFTAKSTSAGSNKPIQSLQGKLDGSDVVAEITLKNPWPVGTYHVDILIDGRTIHGFDYEVTGEKSAIVFLGHSLAADAGSGLPGPPVKVLKKSDKHIFIQVTTKGIDTTEPEVIWRLYKVDNGKDIELGNTVQPRMKLQDSVLKVEFTYASDWAPGKYRTDIMFNGQKVHAIEFQIR
ncbi:MAG: hypothetical protein JSS66_04540 [Armatimonadetes bacterium]|nr:hypothetical protein [Armatimonadota bacterium]